MRTRTIIIMIKDYCKKIEMKIGITTYKKILSQIFNLMYKLIIVIL